MAEPNEVKTAIAKMGAGESGQSFDVVIESARMDDETGFHASGRDPDDEMKYELDTRGDETGGKVELRSREVGSENWETVGIVTFASET
ncbi:MAG: hypothetical protein ABEI52_06635 [Halobacteriaceae archaeon]